MPLKEPPFVTVTYFRFSIEPQRIAENRNKRGNITLFSVSLPFLGGK